MATILRVTALALAILGVGSGIASASRVPALKNHAAPQAVATLLAGSECQPVLAAGDKLFTTPYHMYMTEGVPGTENGKQSTSESISIGGSQYVLFNGKWTASPLSIDELKQMEERNRKTATNQSCHFVRDDSVNGESVGVYAAHSETAHGKNDNQLWISKSRGLILRQETDIDIGDGRPKTHVSARYDYSNVQKPPL